MRKLTTEEFIERAKKTHGDKYDYSQTEYVNTRTKLKIICPEHGEFWQKPGDHVRGDRCPKCAKNRKLDTESFIEKAREVHGDKYDYSSVDYKNNNTKVRIICLIHGEFLQTPSSHMNAGRGCPKCYGNIKSNTKEFIEKAREVHGDKYDYSLAEYKNNNTKVRIICPRHGVFLQSSIKHKSGKGCPKCYGNVKSNTKEFIERAKEIHGDKYDYSLVEYKNNNTKVRIICPKHGIFEQSPKLHVSRSYGCPTCNESKGEKKVRVFLEKNNIDYEYQKIFKDCRNTYPLPFDFYLPEHNYLIEFDGKQHFEINEFFGGGEGFQNLKINDDIKNEYAEENNIDLLRIPYWEIDNIEEILKKPLK